MSRVPSTVLGEYADAETGLVYLRNRYYDPATGQFLTRDPLAAVTQSPYGYVGGNPLNGTDPLGLDPPLTPPSSIGALSRQNAGCPADPAYPAGGGVSPWALGGFAVAAGLAIVLPELAPALFAAEAEGGGLTIGDKIAGQMGPRGWTEESIAQTVGGPAETHPVWDYTTGTQQPATAYVRPDGSYVVVNDATGNVVQVSDATNPNWKPVWDDPRFQR